jgi:hypothetical protein
MMLGLFTQTWTASGSWTAPGNLAFPPLVYAWGPGQTGVAGSGGTRGGAGSGGGAFGGEPALGGVAPGTVLTITITAGSATTVTGGSVTVQANAGTAGSTTTGGAGGTAGSNTLAFAGGHGGNSTNGSTEGGGGGGSGAGPAGAGGTGSANSAGTGGAGGTPPAGGGHGGAGGTAGGASSAGAAGTGPGGGGGGGASSGTGGFTGGAAAGGQAMIIWAVWLPDGFVKPHVPVRQTGSAKGSTGAPVHSSGPTTPAPFTQPHTAVRGQRAAKRDGSQGSTGAPVKTFPARFTQPGTAGRPRPPARKGSAAGSKGAPVLPQPARFTAPHTAVRPQPPARKGSSRGAAGAPVMTPPSIPAPFTQPGRAARGAASARKGTSGGLAAEALTCGSTIASPGLLAGNLLSEADSDFETWSGAWTAGANTAIGQSSKIAFCGCDSLLMLATGNGSVSATSPFLPFTALAGLAASGYLYTAYGSAGHITVSFWNSSLGLISSAAATAVGLLASSWTPVVTAEPAPAGTAWITLTYTVTGMAAGQTAFLDLAYAADTPAQVLIAWDTQPTSSTPLFADVTPWIRADKGVGITRGRTDEVSEVQAAKLTTTLDNTTGWFTVSNPGSPWYPGVLIGRRTQVNECDQDGAWYTRFDGTLTDLPVTWTGGNAAEALTPAAASGVLAKLGRAPGLRTMLEHEMLYDQPMCLYTLAEPSGSAFASDSSGNGAAPLTVHDYGGGTLAFGSGSPIVEAATSASSPITSILCTPAVTGAGPSGNLDNQLEAFLPSQVSAAAGFTFEIWFTGFPFADNTDLATWYAIAVGDPRTGAMLAISVQGGSASQLPALTLVYTPSIYSTAPVFTTASLSNAQNGFPEFMPGMLAVTVSGTTATLWYQNLSFAAEGGAAVPVAAVTIPASFEATYLTVGGPLGGTQGWSGSLNCAAVYPSALPAARLQDHFQAGSDACEGNPVYQLIGNVARYAGLPSWQLDLPTAGVSRAGLYSLYGQGPLAALQTYEQVDGGVLYENAAGQLAYQDRSARYAAQASGAPVLQLAAGQYEPDLLPSITDQFLINDCTTGTTLLAADGTTSITAWTRAVNQASVGNYGTYPDGTPQSPKTGPYYTLSAVDESLNVCQDAADWTTGTCSTPGPRSPAVTVDLLTQPGLRAAVLSAGMGTMLQLQGLPGQYPGGVRPDFMLIEGMTERLKWDEGAAEWTVVFNTSPSMQSGAWLAGDSAMGILDLTAVTGRGSDGQPSGRIGPPYAVPSFTPAMNNTGNVGAEDMRGITANLQQALTPPAACASQLSLAQQIPPSTVTAVEWDTIGFDTASGFNLGTLGNPTAPYYIFPMGGTWLITATVAWLAASGTTLTVIIGQPTTTGQPPTVILAEQTITGAASGPTSQQVSVKVSPTLPWLAVFCSHTGFSNLTLDNSTGGCMLSAVFLGDT